jgi:hypothetical protein
MRQVKITTKEKIKILKNINWKKLKLTETGLCGEILRVIYKPGKHDLNDAIDIRNQIELFTFENAMKFSTFDSPSRGLYWFNTNNEQGYTERIQFVNWMIEQYESKEQKSQFRILTKESIKTIISFAMGIVIITGKVYRWIKNKIQK